MQYAHDQGINSAPLLLMTAWHAQLHAFIVQTPSIDLHLTCRSEWVVVDDGTNQLLTAKSDQQQLSNLSHVHHFQTIRDGEAQSKLCTSMEARTCQTALPLYTVCHHNHLKLNLKPHTKSLFTHL